MHIIIEFLYRCWNHEFAVLLIGFAVGFATAYSAVLWPPHKKARQQ